MYYIYSHVDPITKQIFYIGKGIRGRAYSLNCRSNIHKNKLNKILRTGYTMLDIVFKLQVNIELEVEAYNLEKQYIEEYKLKKDGGILLNLQVGGCGASSGKYHVGYRHDLTEEKFIDLLQQGYNLKTISNKLKINRGIFKSRYYPTKTLKQYCALHSMQRLNHMARIDVTEDQFINYLKQGYTNKEIGKIFKVDQNTLKNKFYPKICLKEYCVYHNIEYVNTQKAVKNGNYKEFDSTSFIKLVKAGCSLTIIEKELQLSKRCIIKKYRDVFNVKNWRELKEALS